MGRTASWIYLWTTLGAMAVLCVAEGRFTIWQNPVVFDKALEACQRAGSFLANIANVTEVSEILRVVSDTLRPTRKTQMFYFWIGLKSGREDCVVGDRPLRGFRWTVDVGSDPEVGRWKEEPTPTCTGTRCALLSGEFNGSAVVDWGLVSSSCQKEYPFLCKKGEDGVPKASCPLIIVPEARSQRIDPDSKLMVECLSGEIHTLNCSAVTHTWILSNGSAADEGICPRCNTGFARDELESCVDVNECENQLNICKHLCTNIEGSYLCQCLDQVGNIHNEGSSACNELTASTVPPVGVTNLHVIQVNTPTPNATILGRPSARSIPASPEPPASPTDNSQVEATERTNVFIPVLIAVMALVVLVVVVLFGVKCCLRRRSQQLAMKKAEKMAMKRSEATKEDRLNGQDSMEHTNEKEAT